MGTLFSARDFVLYRRQLCSMDIKGACVNERASRAGVCMYVIVCVVRTNAHLCNIRKTLVAEEHHAALLIQLIEEEN